MITAISIGRDDFTFSAAHCTQLPDGQSEPLHGHNYSVAVRVTGPSTCDGIVIDFSMLKRAVKEVTTRLNHRVLLPGRSRRVQIREHSGVVDATIDGEPYRFPARAVAIIPVGNTSVEEIARFVLNEIAETLKAHTQTSSCELVVQVEECPGQGASVMWSGARPSVPPAETELASTAARAHVTS